MEQWSQTTTTSEQNTLGNIEKSNEADKRPAYLVQVWY